MKKLLAGAIALSSLVSGYALAESPDFPHLVTTGYGEVVAKPDMAEFSVKVVETEPSAEKAKHAVDSVVEKYLVGLKKSGMAADNIHSSNLYLAPQYRYPKNQKPQLIGYQASRSIHVVVNDLSKLNGYLDLALKDGITQVNNIQLKVKDEAKFQRRARMAAIKDANAKANSLAKGFDTHLGKVWQIDYNAPNNPPVLMRAMAMDSRKQNDSYQDSSIVIRDRVNVIYKLDN